MSASRQRAAALFAVVGGAVAVAPWIAHAAGAPVLTGPTAGWERESWESAERARQRAELERTRLEIERLRLERERQAASLAPGEALTIGPAADAVRKSFAPYLLCIGRNAEANVLSLEPALQVAEVAEINCGDEAAAFLVAFGRLVGPSASPADADRRYRETRAIATKTVAAEIMRLRQRR